ncbi:hypothetical protein CHISP_3295 [Chitinispirillum alkaliphilum]|nr:hypothetical protein CHISP_3295 [Chitinispirillum alkaliphilum]
MHRLSNALTFMFCCVFFLSLSAHSSQKPATAALNQLTGSGIEEGEAQSLTNALRGELTRTGKFNMMERSQVNEILQEQGFQHSGACADEECMVEIGQLLAVRYMFMGHVGRVGATYSVSVRQIDVESGRVMKDITQNYRGDIDNVLIDVIPSVARQLAEIEEIVEQKRRIWPYITGGLLVAAAVPVILFLNSGEDQSSDNTITVEW